MASKDNNLITKNTLSTVGLIVVAMEYSTIVVGQDFLFKIFMI